MSYSIVIRTLGTGGKKYQSLLDSIRSQTWQPNHVLVFIAEGYPLPQEQLGTEKFIYTRKGMWHQRVYGLEYAAELGDSDYILAVDDDISFAPDFVENSLRWMSDYSCDVLAPVPIHKLGEHKVMPMFSIKNLVNTLMGIRIENHWQIERIKIIATGGFMANTKVKGDAMPTQSAQFTAFFIDSKKVKELDLKDEYWLDQTKYALPDDQVFFYKCYLRGFRQYMHDKYAVIHLDHGSSDPNRLCESFYANGRNFLIFWHRFLFTRAGVLRKLWLIICMSYRILMFILYCFCRGLLWRNFMPLKRYCLGVFTGLEYINSPKYKDLPPVYKIQVS